MSNINVCDDFLPQHLFDELQSLVVPAGSTERLFFLPARKTEENDLKMGNIQFVHNMLSMNTLNLLDRYGIAERIAPLSWVKAKFNFTLGDREAQPAGWHVDVDAPHVPIRTGILYLNTNNGYTEFECGRKAMSVANRYVEFDTSTSHRGVNTTDTGWRALLNMNFIRG